MSNISYTEVYNTIYTSMKVDGISPEIAQASARRVTDDLWDLHLSLNFGQVNLRQTIEVVRRIVDSKIKSQPEECLFSD